MERIFKGLRHSGIKVVEVSGGEPFLRKDIFEVLSLLDRLGFLFTVTSNGTVLSGALLEKLNGLSGLLQIGISIDTLDRDLYARLRGADMLPAVLAGLDAIRAGDLSFPLKINFTMSRFNYPETLPLLDFAGQRSLFLSVFPVNQGGGFLHRSDDPSLAPVARERAAMSEIFRTLARLRRAGEPLWEYSGFYDLSADYVLGRPVGPCDAGSLYLDLHADGTLAVCIDQEGFADLLREDVAGALERVAAQRGKITACAAGSPCCYTCTYNLSVTADHIVDFLRETLRVRSPFHRGRMSKRPEGAASAARQTAGFASPKGRK
jgi:MoaA/NifB/PqqE/SkfB family radical SAM enzyme